jgi:hypothetical protein
VYDLHPKPQPQEKNRRLVGYGGGKAGIKSATGHACMTFPYFMKAKVSEHPPACLLGQTRA